MNFGRLVDTLVGLVSLGGDATRRDAMRRPHELLPNSEVDNIDVAIARSNCNVRIHGGASTALTAAVEMLIVMIIMTVAAVDAVGADAAAAAVLTPW